MYRGNYSFSMPKPYASLNMPKKWPEDIECIIKASDPSCGSLYISNVEAAENVNTLKSTNQVIKNLASRLSLLVPKVMSRVIQRV